MTPAERVAAHLAHADLLPIEIEYEGHHITVTHIREAGGLLLVRLTSDCYVNNPYLFRNPPTTTEGGGGALDAFREMVGQTVVRIHRSRPGGA